MRNPILVGDRLYLRPLEKSDATTLAEITATETETFMERGRMPHSAMIYERWIRKLHERQPPENVDFAVCVQEDDRCIGFNGILEIDYVDRTGETETFLGPAEFRSKGYGTEAKHLLLEYAFDHLHLHAIRSWVWEPNTRSAAALIKQGYKLAGRLKWVDVKDGRYRDAQMFDVLREEWVAARDAWRKARE